MMLRQDIFLNVNIIFLHIYAKKFIIYSLCEILTIVTFGREWFLVHGGSF